MASVSETERTLPRHVNGVSVMSRVRGSSVGFRMMLSLTVYPVSIGYSGMSAV